jgi:predicted SnoaL-like aldol condensation-catalyzing enzyme
MNLQVQGKLIQKLPTESGEGRNGRWEKKQFVVETDDQYPKKICMVLWGDKVSMLEKVTEGDLITVSINLESREFNSKWYTDVKAWRIEKGADEGSSPSSAPPQSTPTMPTEPPADLGLSDDDLPF